MYELFITAFEIASATSSLPYPILLTIAPPAASRIFLPSLVYKYAPLEPSNSIPVSYTHLTLPTKRIV